MTSDEEELFCDICDQIATRYLSRGCYCDYCYAPSDSFIEEAPRFEKFKPKAYVPDAERKGKKKKAKRKDKYLDYTYDQ